jgi:hypothetical protein
LNKISLVHEEKSLVIFGQNSSKTVILFYNAILYRVEQGACREAPNLKTGFLQ